MRYNIAKRNDFFNSFFNNFLDNNDMNSSWSPAVDIVDKKDKFLINVDVPGVKKEDISIELKDGYLTVKGERNYEYSQENDNVYRCERTYGSFSRTFNVDGVKDDDIKANFENGTLKIELPKVEAKKPKKIELN